MPAAPEFRQQLVAMLPRLARFALALTRSRPEAADLTQATCERALSRHAQWQSGGRFDGWLFRIMQSIWFNELRARRVRDTYQRGAAASAEEGTDADQRAMHARLLLEKVADAALGLPEEQRSVLFLVCVEGLTYRDAAEVLGIPIGTVMSRLARARLGLMREVEPPDAATCGNVIRMGAR